MTRHEVPGETIADIMTGKPIPLVLYEDDHAADLHTHDVNAEGEYLFRYPPLHRPKTVHLVTFSDYDDERLDSAWYEEAKAVARAEALNRGLWAADVAAWEEALHRFAPDVAKMTEAEIARADAAEIAAKAKERGVRRAAREVRDAISGNDYDPRAGVAYAEAILAQTFEEWMEKSPGAKWRAGGIDVEDAT